MHAARTHIHMLPTLQIASWLSAARAQDVVTVYPAGEAGGPVLISGTAVSQRHAAACVEAVRWQVCVVVLLLLVLARLVAQ